MMDVPDGFQHTKIDALVERVANAVDVDKSTEYYQIGIRSHGKGLFDKEPVLGKELGNKRVFWVEPDCFIVNIVFAWEQAVGLTSSQDKGKIASHRFPMYRPKNGRCDVNFLMYFFKTPYGKHLLTLASPGGAGRNKTLGQAEFLKTKITVPPAPEQQKIAEILSTWDRAIEVTEGLVENSQAQKKALMQHLLTCKKRLKGFSEEWEYQAFDTVFKTCNDKKTQVAKKQYLNEGSNPIVDQGQKRIVGYTNQENVYSDVPVIIFGDHTRILKWIDFCFCPGADGTQILKTKKNTNLRFGYYLLQNAELPNLGYSRHMRELKEKEFLVPQRLEEQTAIVAILSDADRETELLTQKLDTLKQEKSALMQQLLTGKRRVKIDDKAVAA